MSDVLVFNRFKTVDDGLSQNTMLGNSINLLRPSQMRRSQELINFIMQEVGKNHKTIELYKLIQDEGHIGVHAVGTLESSGFIYRIPCTDLFIKKNGDEDILFQPNDKQISTLNENEFYNNIILEKNVLHTALLYHNEEYCIFPNFRKTYVPPKMQKNFLQREFMETSSKKDYILKTLDKDGVLLSDNVLEILYAREGSKVLSNLITSDYISRVNGSFHYLKKPYKTNSSLIMYESLFQGLNLKGALELAEIEQKYIMKYLGIISTVIKTIEDHIIKSDYY